MLPPAFQHTPQAPGAQRVRATSVKVVFEGAHSSSAGVYATASSAFVVPSMASERSYTDGITPSPVPEMTSYAERRRLRRVLRSLHNHCWTDTQHGAEQAESAA